LAWIRIRQIKDYFFPILLLSSIILGGLVGYFFGEYTILLKPLGDVFINLIFIAIGPLVFFSLSSAVARIGSIKKIGFMFFCMLMVFLFTGVIASVTAIITVKLIPLTKNVDIPFLASPTQSPITIKTNPSEPFTMETFSAMLPHHHMNILILFSLFTGLCVSTLKEKKQSVVHFLESGETVTMRVFTWIMYYAPIGFFAYFAVLISQIGPKLIESYARITVIYYAFSLGYFLIAYTGYAYLSDRKNGIRTFWSHVWLPMVTAIATCSSAASIPANLAATKRMSVPREIYETSIPLGTMIHKDGSVIGGVIKIAFLFGIFHMDFSGTHVLVTALGVSLLVGSVMGAIPSGGMLGELLILSFYGFPTGSLLMIAAISIIIDPLATMVSVTGNSVSSMMIARLVKGRTWMVSNDSLERTKIKNNI